MYDWHAKRPEKGKRFAQAMESVSKSTFEFFLAIFGIETDGGVYQDLDPGNGMIIDWLANQPKTRQDKNPPVIIEVSGKTGSFSRQLAVLFPDLRFEVQDSSPELLERGKQTLPPELADRVHFSAHDPFAPRFIQELGGDDGDVHAPVFLLRGVLWNLDNNEAIKLLQRFIPAMQRRDGPRLLISDLVSPAWGTFEPHVDRAFRRRDVTLMTMHNVQQRTASEWAALIRNASPHFKVRNESPRHSILLYPSLLGFSRNLRSSRPKFADMLCRSFIASDIHPIAVAVCGKFSWRWMMARLRNQTIVNFIP